MTLFLVTACIVGYAAACLLAIRGARIERRLSAVQAKLPDALQDVGCVAVVDDSRRGEIDQEYQALLDCCGAGVLVLTHEGVIDRMNAIARHQLGAPTQVLVGRSLLQATLSHELEVLFDLVRSEQCLKQSEVRLPGAGGAALLASIVPIYHGSPASNRFLLIMHDVSELRRLETVRRDFVANVSHELRTPLASIRAMAETLQDGALTDPLVADHFLATIITEAQRLTRISEDLLILSRAESGAPDRRSLPLSKTLTDVAERFQPQAERARVTLSHDIPPDLSVYANPDQVEQVLVNLIDNAIKYTPAGGSVRVTAGPDPLGVAVHVGDTGIGILSQDLPRVFERFYRVDKARSRQSGGTGLGLSIVKHIVEAHGGQVTVVSEYNRGSIFTFTLPATSDSGENTSEEGPAPPITYARIR